MRKLAVVAQQGPFRFAVALVILLVHFLTMTSFAEDRFGLPFNSRPGEPPVYGAPAIESVPENWDRLAVSRWDSAHYISLVLRGYTQCPKQDVRPLSVIPTRCNLNFYPGYAVLGRAVQAVTRLPADFSLFVLALLASFLFLFLWTDPVMIRALGVGGAYASLVAFNAFPNAFVLTSIQTEPCTFAFTLGAFLAFARRKFWLAALLAGAASGMRVSGAAVGAAMGLAILAQLWLDRPNRARDWVSLLAAAFFSGWGLMFMMGYQYWRFGDPLLYVHAHAQSYGHSGSPLALLNPQTEWLLRSIDHPLHEGVVLAFSIVWFILGRKQAMAGFTKGERVFWYGLTVLGTGISLVGSIELGLAGMNRYLLLIFPLFFAIGMFLKTRPALFAFWLVLSFWHYRQVDLCDYLGGLGEYRFAKCYVPQWQGHW